MSRQVGFLLLGMTWAGLAGSLADVGAQESASPPDNRGQAADSTPQTSGDYIWQQGEDGKYRLVPLKSLEQQNQPQGLAESDDAPEESDYFFSKLELEGTANEEWAELTASVTVHLVPSERWVSVPMRFDQASLLDYKHDGPGDITAPGPTEPTRGLTWLMRGAGDHHLQMMLRVPLRKTPSGDLLQLELPHMQLFTGKLKLRLPSKSVTPRPEENVRLLGTQIEGDETVITAELPGDRADLRWTFLEQQAEPLMQKPTEVRLRLLDEKIELTAKQQILFASGQSKILRVRMPSGGFELAPQGVRVIDNSGNDRWIQPAPTDQPDWFTLPLGNSVGNLVQLDWRLSAPMPAEGREIVLDGFEIADARRQTGTIAIENPDGFRLTHVGEDDMGVERMDVDDLADSPTLSALAYSFTGGQYRIRLQVEPTVPVVSATPYYFIKVSPDRLEVEVVYQLSIDGGIVRSVPIIWPGDDHSSWDVVASSLTGGVPRKVQPASDDDPVVPAEWEITLPEVVDNRAIVGLSAVRSIDTDRPAETLSLSLPIVSEARTLSGWVVVSTDDDVEVTTRAGNNTVLTGQPETVLSTWKTPLPNWTNTQPLTSFRFSTNQTDTPLQLEMDLTVQSQTVTTSSVVEVRNLDDLPRVSQRLSYDVQFGRLSEVRLQIPPRLFEQLPVDFPQVALRFLLDGETPLVSDWSRTGSEVTVKLPAPRMGRFDIVIDDYLPQRELSPEPHPIPIPIITPLDRSLTSVQLVVPDQQTLSVAVDDPAWTRISTLPEGMQWITKQAVSNVNIALDRSLAHSPQRLRIDTAFIQTQIDDAGQLVTRATYVIRESITEVMLRLPPDASDPTFQWNGRPLGPTDVTRLTDDQQFRLERPIVELSAPERAQRQVVSIRYQRLSSADRWSTPQTIPLPQFAPGVFVGQLWWELKLPLSQHLFVPPSNMTPQFQWVREGIFWERKPAADYAAFRDSLLETDLNTEPSPTNSGNAYPFVSLGSPTELDFRTISKSMIVFLGAGLTLVASFLLLKVPAARHPLLWLSVGLAAMAASLWFLEPMLLLLQPAAYGLVLPLCAALLEYATANRRGVPRRRVPDSTYREFRNPNGSGVSEFDSGEPPVTAMHVRPTAMIDSGIEA